MNKLWLIIGHLGVVISLIACTRLTASTDISSLTAITPAALSASPTTVNLTQTAIANSVNALFTQTAVVVASATRYAEQFPSPVPTQDPEQDPIQVARFWLNAFGEIDTERVARYTCQANAEQVSNQLSFMWAFSGSANALLQLLSGYRANLDFSQTIDFSDVTISIISQSPTVAVVYAQGEITASVGGQFQTREISQELPMIYEDQRWKVCENQN
jgi:hypothetical protein